MKIIHSQFDNTNKELPLKLQLSFEVIFEYLEGIAKDEGHHLHKSAIDLLKEFEYYPELRTGFSDYTYLDKYNAQISRLLDILFPDLLTTNEIKAASIPFDLTSFKLSQRFHDILNDAGEDYQLKLRVFEESNMYIFACLFIMGYCYGFHVDGRRPFYFDIPNKKTGFTRHYRTLINGDFFKVTPLANARKIDEDDFQELIDNYDNIDLWKEKFPPESYEFKGFGMLNLVDVTSDQIIAKIKELLLDTSEDSINEVEKSISNLFSSKDIKFEFSSYSISNDKLIYNQNHKQRSFTTYDEKNSCSNECSDYFCSGVLEKVFKEHKVVAISNLELYAEKSPNNGFAKTLLKQGFQSVILVPIMLSEDVLGVMELVSPHKRELNSINAVKLNDVIPAFKVAAKRYMEELENRKESIIQEHYTSIHPTVKWKFYEAAEDFININYTENPDTSLKEILFKDVIPLYGQSDIKGSSLARNTAIQKDLVKQLQMAYDVIEKAKGITELPIYSDLQFRINEYSNDIKSGLNSGDEVSLTYFLKKDIYPVFNHLKTLDKNLKTAVENYMNHLDPSLHVVYDERKKYDESVNILNEKLAQFIDLKQVEAQKMFPHYFERYKTDGVDYNMYIGQSLLKNKTYDPIYLYNLRLWQLQMMCEVENVAYNLKDHLEHPLEVASLILIHSTPLTIKFRMDEKRFDVDGAYNIRYEILKKRIDKAHIKNTKERLTIPGKIAIVYSQDDEAEEYMKYIKHLQAKNQIKNEVEIVEIEDLQGSTGLKALRIEVNYQKDTDQKITLDDLMNVIESKS